MNAPGFHPSDEQPIFQAVINQLRFRKFTRDLDPPRLSFLQWRRAGKIREEEEVEGSSSKARRETLQRERVKEIERSRMRECVFE